MDDQKCLQLTLQPIYPNMKLLTAQHSHKGVQSPQLTTSEVIKNRLAMGNTSQAGYNTQTKLYGDGQKPFLGCVEWAAHLLGLKKSEDWKKFSTGIGLGLGFI